MSEAITEERLAKIRANAKGLWPHGDWNDAADDVQALLGEVDRLRAREADLVHDIELIGKEMKEGLELRFQSIEDKIAKDFGGYPFGDRL